MKDAPTVLVIGGSGGLGSETCRTLAKAGFHMVFTYRNNREKAGQLLQSLQKDGHKAQLLHLDLNDLGSVSTAVTAAQNFLGNIGSLVITSGIATGQEWQGEQPKFFDITPEGYDKMMTVNVRGVFFACQQVARIMANNGGGRIVITGSVDGVKPVPAPVDYACCKSALWGLTQSMAKELGKYNILVNMVAPGILEGGIATLLSPELMEEYKKHSSLRRAGTFTEIANTITFLAAPQNTYLTAQALILDGGL